MSEKKITAVGRRKEASARAKLIPGKGLIQINGKVALEYLGNDRLISIAQIPLKSVSLDGKYDIYIKVSGGGKKGQAEAIRHAITRALIKEDESLKPTLRKLGYVTRDPRTKERKKYGLKKARKAPQFSKR